MAARPARSRCVSRTTSTWTQREQPLPGPPATPARRGRAARAKPIAYRPEPATASRPARHSRSIRRRSRRRPSALPRPQSRRGSAGSQGRCSAGSPSPNTVKPGSVRPRKARNAATALPPPPSGPVASGSGNRSGVAWSISFQKGNSDSADRNRGRCCPAPTSGTNQPGTARSATNASPSRRNTLTWQPPPRSSTGMRTSPPSAT